MLLGITERLEYVDAPSHVEDLKRYRARGYAMAGNRIAIVTDHPEDLVEVHIVAEGWPQAAIVAVCVGAAFGLGSWSSGRRMAALVAVVQSF